METTSSKNKVLCKRKIDCKSSDGGHPFKKQKLHTDTLLHYTAADDPQILPPFAKTARVEKPEAAYPSSGSSRFGESLIEFVETKITQTSDVSRDGEECSSAPDIPDELMRSNRTISLTGSPSSRNTIEEFSSSCEENYLNNAILLEETIEDSSDSSLLFEQGKNCSDNVAKSFCERRNNQIKSTLRSSANALQSFRTVGLTKFLYNNEDINRSSSSLTSSLVTLSSLNGKSTEISADYLNNAVITEDTFEANESLYMKDKVKNNDQHEEKSPLISASDKRRGKRRRRSQELCPNVSKEDNSLGYKEDQEIQFKWILCNRNFWEKVPLNNIFNRLPKDDRGVEVIVEDILKMNTGVYVPEISTECLMNLSELVSIIRRIIQQWKRLSLPHLADHFCNYVKINGSQDYTSPDKCVFAPEDVLQLMTCAPPGGRDLSSPGTPTSEEELLKQEMGKTQQFKKAENNVVPLGWQQIYSLLLTMLWKVIPFELWGSSHNQKVMFKVVKTVLKLGCHDKLFLGQVTRGIKHKHFRWALKLKKYCHYTYIIGKVWLWIIRRLILTVINTLFYVTETTVRRNQLVYFRKRVWQCVHNRGIRNLLQSNFCSLISYSEARALKSSYESNSRGLNHAPKSIPNLRFLAKPYGVRPIIPAGMAGLTKLIALQCRLLLREMMKPYEHGSWKVRALSSLHATWLNYIQRVYLTKESKPFYFVRVDVQDAYGSIRHDTLEALIKSGVSKLPLVLKFGCYSTLQYSKKSPSWKSYILLDDSGKPTSPLVKRGIPLVQCGEPLKIQPHQLMPCLLKTITLQIAKVTQRQCVRANRGVPQGGSLSGALCELYYSAMCALHLVNFNKGDDIILRSVDDFLYVTPSSSQAHEFLSSMRKGFPDFNCYINERKTVHNLESGCGQRVTFRGIVVCSESRQILVDGASLSSGLPRYSLRLNKYKSPGQLVSLRLQQVSLARLPLVVLDPVYTKPSGLIANIWRAGFMAGARLISLLANFLAPQGEVNSSFIAQSVAKASGCVCARVKNAWTEKGKPLPFVQELIVIVYVSAVCAVLRMPYYPTWPMLYVRLKSYVKRLLLHVPREQYRYLPKVPKHTIFP